MSVVSACVALWRRRRTTCGLVALLLAWLCLGAVRMHAWQTHPVARLAALVPEEPRMVRLHGVVGDDPVELFSPNEQTTQTCVVDLRHARLGDAWQPIHGRVRATMGGQTPQGRPLDRTGSDPTLRYGDEILVEGAWSGVPPPGNPGQYDWRASLERQRIHGLLRVGPSDGLVILRHDRGHPLLAAAFRLRTRWSSLIRRVFEERDAGLLRSLLLGQRVALDERLKEAFVETGTIHLLVISGFNVGLIAVMLELLLRWMGIPWHLRLAASAVSLGLYAVVTGLQPPVVRATLMAWAVLGTRALDRALSWANTLAAAALAILWVNPTQLFDAGFQLSFGAVASLILFGGRWYRWLESRMARMRPAWCRRYTAASLAATAAVWVGLAPVLARYFYLVAPVSLVANLLIAPLMSALVPVGTAALIIGTFCETALIALRGPLLMLLGATTRCVRWCHAIPGGHWFIPPPSAAFLLGYYGLLAVTVLRHRLRMAAGRVLVCWAVGLVIWVWGAACGRISESRWLRLDVLDVGHGDSIVIRTPRGRTLVVDAGTQEAGRYRVIPFLRQAGPRALDALVLTHTDEDHIGGAWPVLQQFPVGRLLTNGVAGATMSARRVHRAAAKAGVPHTVLASGMAVGDEPDVEIAVLHPPRGLVPGVGPASNDNSVVLRATKGDISVLLCGDIEEAGLPWLIGQGNAARAQVLKVPHHGSRLGEAGARFFDTVQPRIAILSVGRLHHLPSPQTMEALARRGVRLYSTRTHGAISLRTDGRRLHIRTYRSKQTIEITDDGSTKHHIPSTK